MEQGITWRRIDGNWAECTDIGCSDFDGARRNRARVKAGYGDAYYEWLDRTLAATPIGAPLPLNVPIGRLPFAGKESLKGSGFTREGAD